jgi:hypothetical protein
MTAFTDGFASGSIVGAAVFVGVWLLCKASEICHGHRKTSAAVHSGPPQSANSTGSSGTLTGAATANITLTKNTILTNADTGDTFPVEDAGIRAGEVIAWRCWRIVGTNLLASVYIDYVWLAGMPSEGDVNDGYGVFAFKTRHDACRLMRDRFADEYGYGIVMGQVRLWGEIIEHERGYRAQYAEVETIDSVIILNDREASSQATREALRKAYQRKEGT